jgi:transcriptional regulator with XRE-family HTH domain
MDAPADAPAPAPGFGHLLRHWRRRRGHSQMALALDAAVSARHLSWLETGRAQPSRAMVLRLAERLDLPLRERNALLLAAGYAPMYGERPLAHAALQPAREWLQRLLDAHEPWPALAVDRHWHLVAANRMLMPLLQGVAPALLAPPLNVLRLTLHPQGLAPSIDGLPAWREHVLARLARQHAASGDKVLAALLAELRALPTPAAMAAPPASDGVAAAGHRHVDAEASQDGSINAGCCASDHASGSVSESDGDLESDGASAADALVVPLSVRSPIGRLNFITTVTTFGAPHEVALSELAVETLLPADDATATALRRLRAALG